jgi:hypothetical protein
VQDSIGFDFTLSALFFHFQDWPATSLLVLESVGHIMDQETVDLLDKLEKYPGVKGLSAIFRTHNPVLPITFMRGSERLSYVSFITTLGTRHQFVRELSYFAVQK